MRTLTMLATLLIGTGYTTVATNTSEGEFKLVKSDKVVSLYERWIPGSGGEQVREVKALFEVKTGIEAAITLLTDQAKGKEWNAQAEQYKVLSSGNRNQWITYTRYSVPWPFGDQDCCLSHHVSKDPNNPRAGTIYFESIDHIQFPVKTSVTRIQGTKGRWVFEEIRPGTISVAYIVSTNRSKKLPRWVTDPIVRNNLFTTMTTFRSLLEKG
ncbi:START domain-containing protein [Paraflavitalea sp. CAU 1676]|uniref:START domain-containing protein n=1 Tax=Paraflavitalea sp. CAU 1676 TaxID=3032598 RepID=UPI0023DB093E|nr:START domain-containing protein [Paraflavitalea sp. CAU 1676]MDF2187316.1 START domain-containing protein [Paraflavitalea sp. CAU 1676]